MKPMKKFRVGDTVRLRPNLQVGAVYYNQDSSVGDKFTSRMRNNMAGKDAIITKVADRGGYILDADFDNVYYDGMLELSRDIVAEQPYTFNVDVERLIHHMERQNVMANIDKALDAGDKEEFHRLSELYKSM
jgi:hypothetical protein